MINVTTYDYFLLQRMGAKYSGASLCSEEKTFLVVDGASNVQRIVASVFANGDCYGTQASDANQRVLICPDQANEVISLVVADIDLLGKDGIELAAATRMIRPEKSVHFSAQSKGILWRRGLTDEMAAHLEIPFKSEYPATAVRDLVSGHNAKAHPNRAVLG